jgi:O-antigen ligase
MAAVVVLAVLSRLEPALFPAQELGRYAPEFRPRLAYPFDYWNAVGSFAAVTLVLLTHAASRADRPRHYRAAATALLPVAGLALYLSFSRGGMIAAALGCVVILWLSPRRLSAAGALAVGAVGTAVLALLVRSYTELNDGLIEESAARSQGHRVLIALLIVGAVAYAARLVGERWSAPGRAVDALFPHRRKIGVAAALLAVAALAVAAPRIADRVSEFDDPVVTGATETANVQSRLTSGSANGRYQLWSSAWDAWESRPVTGRGAGTFEFWWRRHATIDAPSKDSHSLVFDAMAELGTLGLLALVGVLGSVLWLAFAAARAAALTPRPSSRLLPSEMVS